MRTIRATISMLLALVLGEIALAQSDRHTLDIKAQPIKLALRDLGEQTGIQILFRAEDVAREGLTTPRISGEMSPKEALDRLLEKAPGLKYEWMNPHTVLISAKDADARENTASVDAMSAMRMAQAETSSADSSAAAAGEGAEGKQNDSDADTRSGEATLEEIVVTAQKREERLQDVPVPVTALAAATLVESNQLRLEDYFTRIPGLNLTILGDAGGPAVSIRGITTGGFVNPTVATVIDDIPYGPSTAIVTGNLTLAPELDPSELQRVEVLRGPQGTLYGASSLGGLIKYMTVDPSTKLFSGRVQVGTSAVEHGDEVGYQIRAAVNIPVSETFAIRLSGSDRRDAGYIDNLQTGEDGINRADQETARVAALWRPRDNFSIKLGALYQRYRQDGASEVHLPGVDQPQSLANSGRSDLGDLEQNALINSGWQDRELQAYSAIMSGVIGQASLTSLTGYSVSTLDTAGDVTGFLGNQTLNGVPARNFPGFGVRGAVQNIYPETSKFSQELRLDTPIGDRLALLAGVFYTHEKTSNDSEIVAINPVTGAFAGQWLTNEGSGTYAEYAGFANLTFSITDRLDIQAGARYSDNEIEYENFSDGLFNSVISGLSSPTQIIPRLKSADDALIHSQTVRFRFSPQLMIYGRAAQGYRPGGPQTSLPARAAGLPLQYDHDTTQTAEIGVKGSFMNRRLSYDASAYHIDWKDIQLQLRDPAVNLTYTINAGEAVSKGVELSVDARPLDGTLISAWAAYNDAELTDVPTSATITARAGARLPYSAKWSGNLSLDQQFAMAEHMTATIGASWSYIGERSGRFFTVGVPQNFPKYAQLDLRSQLRYREWTMGAYVNNVTDKRGILRGGRDSNLSRAYSFTYIQPRTVGISLTRTF
jgi:iron complex outermembrane recepter protein